MGKESENGVMTKLLAGGIAGASETIVTYPAEFIKTRRQLPCFSSIPPLSPSKVRGAKTTSVSSLSIILTTYRTTGLSGFYSGCLALVASNSAKSSIRFFSFETTRTYLDCLITSSPSPTTNPTHRRPPWINILSGVIAGSTESLLVVTPGEALKTRVIEDAFLPPQQRRFDGRSTFAVGKKVVSEEGLRALWKGAGPVLSKQATNSAVRFTVFAGVMERLVAQWPGLEGKVGVTLGVGAISGVATVYASMPFDNIKTRMQSAGCVYKGMFDCAIKTFKADGVRAFWRGTTPRLIRLTLSSGITFAVYDQVVRVVKVLKSQPGNELQAL